MKLTKIKYSSAVYFGVMALIFYFFVGSIQYSMRDYIAQMYDTVPITAMMAFVYSPLIGFIVGYLSVLLAIFVYNNVAKRFPISWKVSKN